MPTELDDILTKLELASPSFTPPETALIANALRTIVADQLVILRLQRLLTIHGESATRLDAILSDARQTLDRRASTPSPVGSFDTHAGARARAELARRVDDARTGRDILLAALAFVRDIAPAL